MTRLGSFEKVFLYLAANLQDSEVVKNVGHLGKYPSLFGARFLVDCPGYGENCDALVRPRAAYDLCRTSQIPKFGTFVHGGLLIADIWCSLFPFRRALLCILVYESLNAAAC